MARTAADSRSARPPDDYRDANPMPSDPIPNEPAPQRPLSPQAVTDLAASVDRRAWCSRCDGYGASLHDNDDRCPACGGTGLTPQHQN